jgi:hypothetical protein
MTAAYIPGALVGDPLVRLTSLALLLTTAALVVFTARRWALPHPPLAAVLLLGQPLAATLGFAAVPQTLFSALLAGGFALRAANRHAASLLLISFLPLARLDGIAVVAVWAAVVAVERRYRLLPLLACGLGAWALCGGLVYSDPLWLYRANPYGLLGSDFGAAGFTYGFRTLPAVAGAVILACAVAAVPRVRRIDPALSLTGAGLLAFYVAAWTLPAFQTLATPVYLVSLSVPIALLAHHGIANLLRAVPQQAVRAVVVVIIVGAVTVTAARDIEPLHRTGSTQTQFQLARMLGPDAHRVVASTHPAFDWFTGTATFLIVYGAPQPAPGEYVIWDGNVGARLSSLERLEARGYTVRWSAGEGYDQVTLLERTPVVAEPPASPPR